MDEVLADGETTEVVPERTIYDKLFDERYLDVNDDPTSGLYHTGGAMLNDETKLSAMTDFIKSDAYSDFKAYLQKRHNKCSVDIDKAHRSRARGIPSVTLVASYNDLRTKQAMIFGEVMDYITDKVPDSTAKTLLVDYCKKSIAGIMFNIRNSQVYIALEDGNIMSAGKDEPKYTEIDIMRNELHTINSVYKMIREEMEKGRASLKKSEAVQEDMSAYVKDNSPEL